MITNEMWQRAKEAFGYYPQVDKFHFTSDLKYYAFIATAATKAEILGDTIIHTITRKQVEEHFKEVEQYPTGELYPLFKYMSDNHDLTLLESEMFELIDFIRKHY